MNARMLMLPAAGALFAASPYFGLPAWTPALATIVACLAVSLIGLNLIFGNAGMLALGQAAFVALPGYLSGMLSNLGVPTLAAVAVALVATVGIANLVGRIFIRLPGIFFAVGTLGFTLVVEGLARAFPSVTGGASGLVFGQGTELSQGTWYAIALAALLAAMAAYAWLVRHSYGRTLLVVQSDELAAAVVGIDVAKVKLRAFTIGCGFSAVGGVLLAYFVGVLVPENAGVNRSLEMVAMVMLGGAGSVAGPLLGAFLVQWLFAVAGAAKQYEVLIYGMAFLGAVLFAREGLMGVLRNVMHNTWRPSAGATLRPPRPSAAKKSRPGGQTAPSARTGGSPAGLSVVGIAKTFGGVKAIADVSFEVRPGEIFALVGPNGAGKTTLFNVICGLEAPNAGSVHVNGLDVTYAPVHLRAGTIGRSFQVARLVPGLTAAENVMCRLDQVSPGLDESERRAAAVALLSTFGLQDLAQTRAALLSAGQRKLVDMVRAAVGAPAILLLDEPAVGLTESEVDQLASLLETLRRQRCGIVLVEHNMDFVSRVADKAVVLHGGVLIAAGSIDSVLRDENVRSAYLGVMG